MTDLVSKLTEEKRLRWKHALMCFNPDDAKYWKTTDHLVPYLSCGAEWKACAYVQKVLLETRVEFHKAESWHLEEVAQALDKVDPINMVLLEGKLRHDQLAVIEEIGRFVTTETKALLHPGTTSYDILDTARSYLLKKAWRSEIRDKISEVINKICDLSEDYVGLLQTGRTHLQNTSPVPFASTLAIFAARLAERLEHCDASVDDLRGKISGIVGTGASIEIVISDGNANEEATALNFEKCVLEKLGLEPDYAATQIVQKERLADVGHNITTLGLVLRNFSNDIRILYSSAINELTSRDNAQRLGGSSADAGKNNPINYENVKGKIPIIQSGVNILYALTQTDLQRDLSGSVQARYEPNLMLVRAFESFCRVSEAIDKLSVHTDIMAANLQEVRDFPSEPMTAITRAHGYMHPTYGIGHDAVKKFAQVAKQSERKLLEVALEDEHFEKFYRDLPEKHQRILQGELELYIGPSEEKARMNVDHARKIANVTTS